MPEYDPNIERQLWDRAQNHNRILVDGSQVHPATVGVVEEANANASHSIELRIAIVILIHELHEAEVDVEEETLLQFIAKDIAEFGVTAIKGYLQIIQMSKGSTQKPGGFFWKKAANEPQPITWLWTKLTDVILDGEVLIMRGECVQSK